MADVGSSEPVPPTPRTSFLDTLGPRATWRATPRLNPVLGGAGALLAFAGLVMLSFDNSELDAGSGDSNKMVGALLCAAGVAAGYALIAQFRSGGLATFGSVVAVLLLPFVFFFLTFDQNKNPPFSIDVILLLSMAGWLAGYAFGPSRGRPLFLGAAATGLWLFILEQVEGAFTAPFDFIPFANPVSPFVDSGESIDPGTVGAVCLVFAFAYLGLAWVLDRRGYHGMATPLLAVAFVCLFTGFFSVQDDLEPAGAGVVLLVAGLCIVFAATRLGRRGSAWLGGLAVALGVSFVVGDVYESADNVTGPALTLMVLGAALALAADQWARIIDEPAEVPETAEAVDVVEPESS